MMTPLSSAVAASCGAVLSVAVAVALRLDRCLISSGLCPTDGPTTRTGLITRSGAHGLALAAKAHSVPLVALAGLHQLCPLYPHDQDTFNELGTPMQIMDMGAAVTHR
eukprot:COSAG01_NODE_3365_length_6192_cov_3.999179_7_plen_108_part_00